MKAVNLDLDVCFLQIALEVPPFLARQVGNVLHGENQKIKSFLALKLITMAKFSKYLLRNMRKRYVDIEDVSKMNLPQSYIELIRTEFFQHKSGPKAKRFEVSTTERERLFAYFLCLALVFDGKFY